MYIEWLYKTLGHERYCRLFPIILTDRGSELPTWSPLSVPGLWKYAAESSIVIPSVLTRRAAARLPTNLSGVFFPKVHPLTICSRAMSCSWWAILTPIRERSWITSQHTGCSASYTEKLFCPPSEFRKSPQTILIWHPDYSKNKKTTAAIQNISVFRGGSYFCKFCKNTSTSVWHAHFYTGCPIRLLC